MFSTEVTKCFLRAILAGVMISIGGIAFLNSEYEIVGAVLFSVGLFATLAYNLNLYTGKICYVFNEPKSYLTIVFVTIIGNFVGCLIMGLCFPYEAAVALCESKLSYDWFSVLVKSIGCGILIYIAVDLYKEKKNYLATFVCVPAFIIAGFEHSIADMFYFSSAMMFSMESLIFILIVILGNAIGGVIMPLCKKYLDGPCACDS